LGKTVSTKTTAQDIADRLQRQAQAAKLRAELAKVLFNRAGLDRLRAISDEEWQRAQEQDDNQSPA
jgi:hypothetical protein